MRRTAVAGAGLVAALLGFAPSAIHQAAPSTVASPAVHDPFLRPVLEDPQGRKMRLADFKGKVRVFDIWASWCGPCRMGIPDLNDLYARYRNRNVVVVGISVDEDPADVVRFTRSVPIRYPHALMNREAEKLFGLDGGGAIPITFIVDRDGKVRRKFVGLVGSDAIAREIERLL